MAASVELKGTGGGEKAGPSVLFINRVYPPVGGATGQLLAQMAGGLAERGWRVSVVTVAEGAVPAGDTQCGSVLVRRVRSGRFERSALLGRAFGYVRMYPMLLAGAIRLPRHDVVVTMTDPPMLLAVGPVLRLGRRSEVVHWAQDVYPEVAEELGVLRRDGVVAGACRWVARWALRRHAAIVAVGRCMSHRLEERGICAGRVHTVPNWAVQEESGFRTAEEREAYRERLGWKNLFVVMYSGNMGLAHEFSGIIGAASELEKDWERVRFVFVGEGPQRRYLEEQTADFRNVEFLPMQPAEWLGRNLSAADLHLASMKSELSGLVVPSKVYGAIRARRPCIFLGPKGSEAATFLSETGCGSVMEPENGKQLAETLRRLSDGRERIEGDWERAMEQVSFERALGAFEGLLAGVIGCAKGKERAERR